MSQNIALYNVENAVVQQKDVILGHVLDGEYQTALHKLDACALVWKAVDYAYKGNEIALRILLEIREDGCIDDVVSCRLRDQAIDTRAAFLSA
jgi:hypothetical protein